MDHCDWKNGVTDDYGSIDEGEVHFQEMRGRVLDSVERARALIQKYRPQWRQDV